MNRVLVFWTCCLPLRLGIAWLAGASGGLPKRWRLALAGALALAGLAFAALFAFGLRMEAPESSTGVTWWNALRPVHAGVFLASASYVAGGAPAAARLLLAADAAAGALKSLSR